MPGRLQIHSLGHLMITEGGNAIMGFIAPEAEVLLVYLARQGTTQGRQKLVTLVGQGRMDLDLLLSSLREQVADYLTVTGKTVGMNMNSAYWLDANELEQKLEEAEREWANNGYLTRGVITKIDAALKLYEGDFLDGVHVRDSVGLRDWMVHEREGIRQRVMGALRDVVRYYVELEPGRMSSERDVSYLGIEQVDRALLIDPAWEEMHRSKMLLLARLGQQGRALSQFDACRDALGREPSPETVTLVEKIRAGEIRPPSQTGERGTRVLASHIKREQAPHPHEAERPWPKEPPPRDEERASTTRRVRPRKMTCRNCGLEMSADSLVCEHCGEIHRLDVNLGGVEPDRGPDSAYFGDDSILLLHFGNLREPVPVTLPADGAVILGRVGEGASGTPILNLTSMGAVQLGVSREHARIERRGKTIVIADLGSSNGTFHNNRRLRASDVRALRNGDQIRLGKMLISIRFRHRQ